MTDLTHVYSDNRRRTRCGQPTDGRTFVSDPEYATCPTCRGIQRCSECGAEGTCLHRWEATRRWAQAEQCRRIDVGLPPPAYAPLSLRIAHAWLRVAFAEARVEQCRACGETAQEEAELREMLFALDDARELLRGTELPTELPTERPIHRVDGPAIEAGALAACGAVLTTSDVVSLTRDRATCPACKR